MSGIMSVAVKLENLINTNEFVFREFLPFVYLRDLKRVAKLFPRFLLSLLQLADYHELEDLLEVVHLDLEAGYCSLSRKRRFNC
jgi:hypothetical protein